MESQSRVNNQQHQNQIEDPELANLQVEQQSDSIAKDEHHPASVSSPKQDTILSDQENQGFVDASPSKKYNNQDIQGVIPKQLDEHERKQMMGFIAYAQNIENTIKLLTFNKNTNLNDTHDKNRIFVTGNTMFSAKLSTSKAAQEKVLDQLAQVHVNHQLIKRSSVLDRYRRQQCQKVMRDSLQLAAELQQRYVEINEFKKQCVNVDKAIPLMKDSKKGNQNQAVSESQQHLSEKDEDEDEDEQRQHQIHVNQRRRRKYRNSFQNAQNLIQWEENTKSANFKTIKPGNNYWFKNITYDFEIRDKKQVLLNMKTIIKLDNQDNNSLQQSKSKANVIGWTNYNPQLQNGFYSQQDNYESMLNQNQEFVGYKGQNQQNIRNNKKQQNGNMDLLKKFRYNFHYWLKNCYQPENQAIADEEHNKEIYQTTQATNTAAGQISQMAKNGKLGPIDTKSPQITQRNFVGHQMPCPNCQGIKEGANENKKTKICDKCLKNLPSGGGGHSRQRSDVGQSLGGGKSESAGGSQKEGSSSQTKPSKYMVIQMGQSEDELQDQMLIQFLSQNALAIKHHPGAVQFQVSKQMLSTLKKRFAHMRALLPKKEGEGESTEQAAKQAIDAVNQQTFQAGPTTSLDPNQKPGRNAQFSHVLHPGAAGKGGQQRAVEASLDSNDGTGEQIRIKNFFKSPKLLDEGRKMQDSALNGSKGQSQYFQTNQSIQASQKPTVHLANGQIQNAQASQSFASQQQSRYSSRSRLNSQSNKNSNMNSTFELKSQQQQFINKISSNAGKSKASLERTLVASRGILNRHNAQRPQGQENETQRTLQPQKKLQLQLSQKMQSNRVKDERGYHLTQTLQLKDQNGGSKQTSILQNIAQKRMQGALSNLTPASNPAGKVVAQALPSPGLHPGPRNLAQAQGHGMRYGSDRFDLLRQIPGKQRQNTIAGAPGQPNPDLSRLPHYETPQPTNSRNPQSPKHHLSPLESAERALKQMHPQALSGAKQGSHHVNSPTLGRMANNQLYQRPQAVSVPEVNDQKTMNLVNPLLSSPLSSTAPKGKGSLYQGDVSGSRGYRSNLNHHAGAYVAQQKKGNQSPFSKKDANKREFTSNMSLHNNSFSGVNHRIGQALGQVASEDERIFASMANGGF